MNSIQIRMHGSFSVPMWFMTGAISGAITGAASGALKVGQAAKAWDASSQGELLKNRS